MNWAIIAADDSGVTIEARGPDPEALADKVASWAQQEEDKWPEMGLVYMLVEPAQVPDAERLDASSEVDGGRPEGMG